MRQNVAQERRNRNCLSLLFVPALAVFLTVSSRGVGSVVSTVESAAVEPAPALQVVGRPWTAIGSTGVVDEDSTARYAFGTTDLTFKAGASGSTIVARYNVTNTYDNSGDPNKPLWKKLEMGSSTPLNTFVEAKLYRVKKCDTQQTLICTATNKNGTSPCAECIISEAIDFANNLYYVEVTLNRGFNFGGAQPRLYTLRVF
jgi:hypothetical protein